MNRRHAGVRALSVWRAARGAARGLEVYDPRPGSTDSEPSDAARSTRPRAASPELERQLAEQTRPAGSRKPAVSRTGRPGKARGRRRDHESLKTTLKRDAVLSRSLICRRAAPRNTATQRWRRRARRTRGTSATQHGTILGHVSSLAR